MSAVLSLIKKLRKIDSSDDFSIGSIASALFWKAERMAGFKLDSLNDIFSKAILSFRVQIVTESCLRLSLKSNGLTASATDFM